MADGLGVVVGRRQKAADHLAGGDPPVASLGRDQPREAEDRHVAAAVLNAVSRHRQVRLALRVGLASGDRVNRPRQPAPDWRPERPRQSGLGPEVPHVDELVLARGQKRFLVPPENASNPSMVPAGLDPEDRHAVVSHLVLRTSDLGGKQQASQADQADHKTPARDSSPASLQEVLRLAATTSRDPLQTDPRSLITVAHRLIPRCFRP